MILMLAGKIRAAIEPLIASQYIAVKINTP